jgi:patatin-related protein
LSGDPRGLPLTVLPPSRRLAEATAGQAPAFGRTLRFALAMRGGVSLAVWIGGAVAELDLLRRIRIHRDGGGALHAYLLHPSTTPDPLLEERAAVYARLLADAGYDRVELDLLAGASAGGLNGVVHAVAQRAGSDMDALGRIWAEHGALGRLLRPLGRRPVDSLLRGDDYLWPRLLEALEALRSSPEHHPDLVAEHVTVELSATVLDSDPSPYSASAEGRGDFHFSSPEPGSPAPTLDNDIPGRDTAPAEAAAALSRLAYAARATASFPGAFEPASVWAAPTPGPRGAPGPADGRPDLAHAFGAHRAPSELPYHVVDGGVFDNIPIDRALEVARTRTSLRHADRGLLYLDPDPPHRERQVPFERDLPRLVGTLAATVTRLPRRESDDDEVLALSDYLDAQLVAHGRLHPLAALAGSWDGASLEERRRAYVRYRARADADLLARLLTRPAEWQLTSTLARRDALRARPPRALEPLRTELLRRYDDLSRGTLDDPAAGAVLRGAQALFDAASCALSWVRVLEDLDLDGLPGPAGGFGTARARERAYRVLTLARHERDRRIHAVLAAVADPAAELTEAVDPWLGAAGAENRPTAGSWAELDAVVNGLRGLHAAVDGQLDADVPGRAARRAVWEASPWSRIPAGDAALGAVDLPPLLAAAGIPAAVSPVAYGEISGDQVPAAADAYPVLRASLSRDRLQQALDAPGAEAAELARLLTDGDGRMPASTKLAGAGLLNFRGFLAGDWRANDWWWGRLDAAAGVAGFLRGLPAPPPTTSPGAPGAPLDGSTTTVDPVVAGLQDALLRDVGHGSAERGRTAVGASADGLDRLTPGHRLSLTSRGVRVLGRALAGTPDLPRPVWEVVLLVLQPLLVLVPAVVTPVRAALVAVALAAGLWSAAGPVAAGGRAWSWPGAALLAAGSAVLVLSLLRTGRRALRRWAAVRDATGVRPPPRTGSPPAGSAVPPVTAGEVTAARRGALRRTALVGAAALSLLLPLWTAVPSGRGAAALLLVLAVLALERLAAVVAVRVPRHGGPDEVGRTALVVLAAVAVWAGAVLTGLPDRVPDGAGARAAALALALLAVGALLLAGWVRLVPALVVAVAAAVLGGAAAWVLWSWTGGPGSFWTDLPAVAGAAYAWAFVLWWAPSEGMLRRYGPGEELLPRP